MSNGKIIDGLEVSFDSRSSCTLAEKLYCLMLLFLPRANYTPHPRIGSTSEFRLRRLGSLCRNPQSVLLA